jgi:hypothetical protein
MNDKPKKSGNDANNNINVSFGDDCWHPFLVILGGLVDHMKIGIEGFFFFAAIIDKEFQLPTIFMTLAIGIEWDIVS